MDKRKKYIEMLSLKLHEWDNKIDEIKTKAEMAGKDARLKYKQQVLELKDRRDKAAKLLEEMHEAGDKAWDDLKTRSDRLVEDVKKIFKKAA